MRGPSERERNHLQFANLLWRYGHDVRSLGSESDPGFTRTARHLQECAALRAIGTDGLYNVACGLLLPRAEKARSEGSGDGRCRAGQVVPGNRLSAFFWRISESKSMHRPRAQRHAVIVYRTQQRAAAEPTLQEWTVVLAGSVLVVAAWDLAQAGNQRVSGGSVKSSFDPCTQCHG